MSSSHRIAAVERVDLAEGAAVLFASDLHLQAAASPAVPHLARAIDALPQRSLLVLGGDVLELLDNDGDAEPGELLAAHPDLLDAVGRARRERDVTTVWLVGNHDRRLLWDAEARARATALTGCRFAFAADVGLPAGRRNQRVWFEHGNAADRFNRFDAAADRHDTPLGDHVVREVLPALRSTVGPWVDDAALLPGPAMFPAFVASRLWYRRVVARWPWLVLGVVGVALVRLLAVLAANSLNSGTALFEAVGELAVFGAIDVAVLAVVAVVAANRFAARFAASPPLVGPTDLNAVIAEELRQAHPDHVGLVTGHSHSLQLSDAGGGFYANPGCCSAVVRPVNTPAGLPAVFQRSHDAGWLLVRGDEDGIHAELHQASTPDLRGMSVMERVLAGRRGDGGPTPRLVAAWPEGPSTAPDPPRVRGASVRRFAAALVAVTGAVTVVSAVSPPSLERLRLLRPLLSLVVPLSTTAVSVVVGLALLVLALGLARGQRRAHRAVLALLAVAAIGNLLKALDVEEAVLSIAALLWLAAVHDRFSAPATRDGVGRRLAVIAATVLAGTAVGAVMLTTRGLAPAEAAGLAVRELFGVISPRQAPAGARFVAAGLLGLGFAAIVAAAGALIRRGRAGPGDVTDEVRARVQTRGTDSLAYFALRDDKRHFLYGDSVVAYGVFGRVALVSPDPIGPAGDLERAITAFRADALAQGWITAVLAAAPEPAARYRALGLHTLYLGDEAVARFGHLDLSGRRWKSLRGQHNRAVRAGYHAEFYDPAALPADIRAGLEPLVAGGRRGDAERGFSMTLGRLFDPRDTGLLLAVAVGPNGPGAFCQFVPAADVGGWSLDVMRHAPDTPNGLTDFLLVETMRYVADQGCTGLGLNFATMRAVVDPAAAGPSSSPLLAAERRVLHSLSEDFQIESLWQFNAKYDPEWRPRYLVYESPAHLPEIAVAIARAESFWELPVLGRFLRPRATSGAL